jgi:hypothetical protein
LRLLGTCLLSLLIYALLFGLLLDRPLSLGLLRLEIAQKSARLATLPTPKLVILAGSNAPYSHSCAVIGPMLNLPCENAGIAVGINLDFLARLYAPSLHPGDIVYMPMELSQYATTRQEIDAAPDGAILLRHARRTLLTLPPDRILAALFSQSFANLLESLIEMPMRRVISPQRLLAQEFDIWGDRINTPLAAARPALLGPPASGPPAFAESYGATLIGNFVSSEAARGVTVIGGLPTGFIATAPTASQVAQIRALYLTHGGAFAVLPNHSRYPRADFYDSPDHLAAPCQYRHSIAVAALLAEILHRPLSPPPPQVLAAAQTCPS